MPRRSPLTIAELGHIEAHPATLLLSNLNTGYAVSLTNAVIIPDGGTMAIIRQLHGRFVDSVTTTYNAAASYGALDRMVELGVLREYRYPGAWLQQIQQHPAVRLRLRQSIPCGIWVYERTLAGQFIDYTAATTSCMAAGPTIRHALTNLFEQERLLCEVDARAAQRLAFYRTVRQTPKRKGLYYLKQIHKNPVFKELVITPLVVFCADKTPDLPGLQEDIMYHLGANYWHRWYRYLSHHTAVRLRLIEETVSKSYRVRTFLLRDLKGVPAMLKELEVLLVERIMSGEARLALHMVDRQVWRSVDWGVEVSRLFV